MKNRKDPVAAEYRKAADIGKKVAKLLDFCKIFEGMPTTCSPWSASKSFAKKLGIKYPDCNRPVTFQWSREGSGFGEFTFYWKNGRLHCDNEMESKEFVKAMLCQMVDDCVFGKVWEK